MDTELHPTPPSKTADVAVNLCLFAMVRDGARDTHMRPQIYPHVFAFSLTLSVQREIHIPMYGRKGECGKYRSTLAASGHAFVFERSAPCCPPQLSFTLVRGVL